MTLKKMSVAANDIVLNNLVRREKTFKPVPQRHRWLLLSAHFSSWLCQPARCRPPASQLRPRVPLRPVPSPAPGMSLRLSPQNPFARPPSSAGDRNSQLLVNLVPNGVSLTGGRQVRAPKCQSGHATQALLTSRGPRLASIRVQSCRYAEAARLAPPRRPLSSHNWLHS